jgi:hypothetical protein
MVCWRRRYGDSWCQPSLSQWRGGGRIEGDQRDGPQRLRQLV